MVEVFYPDMDPFNPKEGEPAFGGMDDLQSDLRASPDLTRLLEKVNEGTDMVAADDRKLKKAERDRVRARYHNDPDLKYPDSPASRQKRLLPGTWCPWNTRLRNIVGTWSPELPTTNRKFLTGLLYLTRVVG